MNEDFEFSPIEQNLVKKCTNKALPINTSFELTPYCNMSCKMCYVVEHKAGLSLLRKDHWLNIAQQAVDAGVLFVLLTGGEPLLHPDFKEIYCGLKKMGLILTINTNGTLINEQMADFFANDMPRRINISLYGPSDEVYKELCGNSKGFTQTKKSIELLLERKVPVKINIVANTVNYPYLDKMYDFCKKYGLSVEANSYLFEPLRKTDGGQQQYRLNPAQMADANVKWDKYRFPQEQMMVRSVVAYEALKNYKKPYTLGKHCITCRAGTSSCWICWDGRMTPCVNIPFPSADIREQGFQKAWSTIVQGTSKIKVSGKCKSCSLNTFCNKCAAYAYHENGEFGEVPQIICQTTYEQLHILAKNVERLSNRHNDL